MKKFFAVLALIVVSSQTNATTFAGVTEMNEQCRGAIIALRCYGDEARFEPNSCNTLDLLRKAVVSQAQLNLSGTEDMDLAARLQGRDGPSRRHGVYFSPGGEACAAAIANSIKDFASAFYQKNSGKALTKPLYLESMPLSIAYSGYIERNLFPNSVNESVERYAKSKNDKGAYIEIHWSKSQFLNSY